MKLITTNRLNRFWKNGVLPIKNALANKLNTANVVNNLLTTAAGYALVGMILILAAVRFIIFCVMDSKGV